MSENEKLCIIAKDAANNAYAPYSNFKVGAALLSEDDIVYTGCNIENASYGATNCAERTAIFKAISEGKRNFTKIAVTTVDGKSTPPCGMCRQVLMEFMPEGEVIFIDKNNDIIAFKVSELLPHNFELEK